MDCNVVFYSYDKQHTNLFQPNNQVYVNCYAKGVYLHRRTKKETRTRLFIAGCV